MKKTFFGFALSALIVSPMAVFAASSGEANIAESGNHVSKNLSVFKSVAMKAEITDEDATYYDPAYAVGISAQDSYTMSSVYDDKAISEIGDAVVKRVIVRGDYLYILALNDTAPILVVYNHVTGETLRTLGTTVCAGDLIPLSDIAMTSDGVLVGCGKGKQVYGGTAAVFLYKWENDENGIPKGEASSWLSTNNGGNYSNSYAGETMCYAGSWSSGTIYYTAETTGSTTAIRIVGWKISNGSKNGDPWHMNLNSVSGYTKTDMGSILLFASPNSDSNFIFNGTLKSAAEFQRAETKAGVPTLVSTLATTVNKKAMHTGMFRYGGKIYLVGNVFTSDNSKGYKLFDISSGLSAVSLVSTVSSTTSTTTNPACCVGTTIMSSDDNGVGAQMAMFMVRDGAVSKAVTPIEYAPKEAPSPVLATSMEDYNFGDVKIGKSAEKSFTIAATYLTDGVNISLSGDNADMFSVSASSIDKSSANGSEVTVSYAPTDANAHSAVLTVQTEGADALTYALSGQGYVPVATMSTSMSDYNFGDVKVGKTVKTSFTITAEDLTGDVSIEISGANASMFSVSKNTVNKDAANGAAITIYYTPSEAGEHSASISIQTEGVEAQSFALSGSGVQPEAGEIPGLKEVWNYSVMRENVDSAPWFATSGSYSRSMTLYDGALSVLNTTTSAIGAINRVNPYTGESIGTMSINGISKVGTHILSSIKALGSRMYGSSVALSGEALQIYCWESASADPVLVLSTTDHGGVRVGDILSVWGDDNEGRLMFCDGTNKEIVYYTVKDGVVDSTPNIVSLATSYGGSGAATGVIYDGDGTYWIFSKDYAPTHVAADGSAIESFSSIPDKYGTEGVFFDYDGHKYLAASGYDGDKITSKAIDYGMMFLIDYTDGVSNATNVGSFPSDGFSSGQNTSFHTSVAYEQISSSKQVNLWIQVALQGIAYYSYGGDATGVQDITSAVSADKMVVRRYPSMIKILGVDPAMVQIYSVSGAAVLRVGAVDEIDTAALNGGIYILRVLDKQGRVHTAKVAL